MIKEIDNGFEIILGSNVILRHTRKEPAFYTGKKDLDITMDKGEFLIDDQTRYEPAIYQSMKDNTLFFKDFEMHYKEDKNLSLTFEGLDRPIQVHLQAEQDEKIYGMGEHFTALNLRGHKVKNWVEEHITRKQIYNKIFRRLLHLKPKKWAFEDYKTYFVTPTFISSSKYFCHVETNGYGVFDFTDDHVHKLSVLSSVSSITFQKEDTMLELAGALCKFSGQFPPLPEWMYDGLILGIQGGTDFVKEQTTKLINEGAKITAIWAQDWCGELHTYFGKQVKWNWSHDSSLYPNLQEQIKNWNKGNIHFMGYINPYLKAEEPMFHDAKKRDYLVKSLDGSIFLTQATSFQFGIVDLTNPQAYAWFKSIIKTNMIDFGMHGWMADFGEYLPTDCLLYEGHAEDLHNQWPDLWIRLNKELLEETNNLSKLCFFNRAGYKDNTRYTSLIWNGDQHVDFTDDFGMRSALRAKLSLAFSGVGLSHSDIGGYTTVPGVKRSKELFLRWLEMNTFTPILRSHEGNKPNANVQPYTDQETIKASTRFSNIHVLLKPYFQAVEQEYHTLGYPMIRPSIFHQDDFQEDAFFVGKDLYVKPVMKKKQKTMDVTFTSGKWTHLFTGEIYDEGTYKVQANIGCPPVFYRTESTYKTLFNEIQSYILDTQ